MLKSSVLPGTPFIAPNIFIVGNTFTLQLVQFCSFNSLTDADDGSAIQMNIFPSPVVAFYRSVNSFMHLNFFFFLMSKAICTTTKSTLGPTV